MRMETIPYVLSDYQKRQLAEARKCNQEIIAADCHNFRSFREWSDLDPKAKTVTAVCRKFAKESRMCCFILRASGDIWRVDPSGKQRKVKNPCVLQFS